MNKWFRLLLILVILGGIAGYLVYTQLYNKPHRDFERAAIDYELTAEELFSAYVNDPSEAQQKYTGKVLQISGDISSVAQPDSLVIVVFALQEGMFGEEGIRCTVLPNHQQQALSLKPDEAISIKGYCTGYNETDVILEKCSFPNK